MSAETGKGGTTAPASYITDELLALVGRTMATQTSFPLERSDIRRWATAIYYPKVPPRQFWDEEYAAGTVWGGIVAPEEFNPFGWMNADPPPVEAYVGGGRAHRWGDFELALGVAPPPYRAVLQGQVIAHYSGVRMRPGDVIRSRQYISEYFERTGRMGLQLYTTISVDFHNQHDEWIKRLDTVFIRYE
jgi:hypothetical protein